MSPLEKMIAHCQKRVSDRLHELNDHINGFESPIEKHFYLALLSAVMFGETHFAEIAWDRKEDPLPRVNNHLYVTRQHKHGNYRIDFLIEVHDGDRWVPLAVECDGHDFHERTKEQAKRDRQRDRSMTMDGLTVFRFTGSEIYGDPMACALQVIDWAQQQAWRNL